MRHWIWLFLIALFAVTTAPSAQPRATLDGVWRAVAAERDGANATDVVGHKLTLAGGKFTIARDGKTVFGGTYTTDASKQPAQIDFANTEGTLKGTWKGIYLLDGGTLKICDNAPDMTKPRPAAFSAPAGSGHVFVAFVRDQAR
jgi:uncharacterized protein (TIGR03067 family)